MVKQVAEIGLIRTSQLRSDRDGLLEIGLGSLVAKLGKHQSIVEIAEIPACTLRDKLKHALEVVIESLFVPQLSERLHQAISNMIGYFALPESNLRRDLELIGCPAQLSRSGLNIRSGVTSQ